MNTGAIQGWDDLGSSFFKLSGSAWALVPLEAWRRGLSVELMPSARYRISDEKSSATFWQTRLYGGHHEAAVAVANDKNQAKRTLSAAGVRVPQGAYFAAPFDRASILAAASRIGYPICLKPNALAKARGVFPGVQDESTLATLLDYLTDELQTPGLLVEENINGDTVRVVVCGDQVIAATLSVPANVIGDGASTIAELIAQKNQHRQGNPHLRYKPLGIDKESELRLTELGLSLDSVVEAGREIFLRKTSNLSAGGDSYDVTDTVSNRVRQIAVAAVKALPDLQHAGVDVLTENYRDEDAKTAVCEVNPSCGLGGHIYPAVGERKDVPRAFIDHHFPNSRRLPRSEFWHFALTQVERLFTSQAASVVKLKPMPQIDGQRWRRVLAALSARDAGASNQVLRALTRTGVHGEVRAVSIQQLEVLITGDQRSVNRAEKTLTMLAGIGSVSVASNQPFVVSPGFRIV